MKKKCFKCNKEKDLDLFYKHSQTADKHLNKCIDCAKLDSIKRYNDPIAYKKISEYEKERSKRKDRKLKMRIYHQNERKKFKDKFKARTVISNGIRDGLVIKQNCEVCGSKNSQAHHKDYSKPLDVKWLCSRHHADEHKKLNKHANAKCNTSKK